jgi:hypothetical protein
LFVLGAETRVLAVGEVLPAHRRHLAWSAPEARLFPWNGVECVRDVEGFPLTRRASTGGGAYAGERRLLQGCISAIVADKHCLKRSEDCVERSECTR